jgi:hypothetical protein
MMRCIQSILPGLDDHQLEIHLITEMCKSAQFVPTLDRESLIAHAINITEYVNNPLLKCQCSSLFQQLLISHDYILAKFYQVAGGCFHADMPQAMQFYEKALNYQRCVQTAVSIVRF